MRLAFGTQLVAFGLLPLTGQTLPSEPVTQDYAQARARLEAWRDSRQVTLRNDWSEQARYRQENQRLAAPKAGEPRVVFLGDSIIDAWPLDHSFPGRPYLNRGISGQTTGQMLLRFRADVIDLKPKVVFILAGTNDISGNSGPAAEAEILANLASMGDLARANGIRVVFCAVLPVHNDTPAARDFFACRPMARIRALNLGLQALCQAHGHAYLDAFTPLLNERGLLKTEWAEDGLHPNGAGYRALAPLVETALKSILSKG